MKKRFLGIFSLMSLLAGFSFAQETQYSFCNQIIKGEKSTIIKCESKEICNNPDGYCTCSPRYSTTNYQIAHNNTCIENTTYMRNIRVSSFAVSGSTIEINLDIDTNNGARIFELEQTRNNPKIKITNINANSGTCNGDRINPANGNINPRCSIDANKVANITITGELLHNSYIFDNIDLSFFTKQVGENFSTDSKTIKIFPTTNYSISQRLLETIPTFVGNEAKYEITVRNNSSKANTNNQTIKTLTYLDQNLTTQLESNDQGQIINELSALNIGESKTFIVNSVLKHTPLANTKITTTSKIEALEDMISEDNEAVTSFNTKTFLDLQIESVSKTNEEPETQGNEIGFLIKYKNQGNDELKNIVLNAEISGINKTIQQNLNNLNMEGSGSVLITGLIDKSYELGTKFCLSGNILASNETQGIENNKFEDLCYTYMKSADLEIEAELTNELNTINSGSELIYNIRIKNLGEKTATGITLKLSSSNNQKEQATIITPAYVDGGQIYETIYKTILTSYPAAGTNISLSGEVALLGIDSNLNNNKFYLEKNLAALPDVFVEIRALPFNGWKIGDTISYIIFYGNMGYGSALNPKISLELPNFIKADQIERNLGGQISAGQTGEIQVIGTLTENLSVNTSFETIAKINSDSAQVSIENDISKITSTVVEQNNISFDMSVKNISWPMGDINTTHTRAASGHNVIFTINYKNDGNVPANNVSISMPNHGPLTVLSFNNISTIGIGQAGTIEIQGKIYGTNFPIIKPTATLGYNNQKQTFSVTIEEPYECGDGLITRDEVCDTALNVDYGRGQSCVNQGGVCVLTTEFISNTACVEAGGVEVCDTHDLLLKDPICENTRITYNNGSQVSVTCDYNYAFVGTPYRINCGNDNILTGFVGVNSFGAINNDLQRICSYPNEEIAKASTIRCQIGNEIDTNTTQANCVKRMPSCEVDPETKVVILDNGRGEVLVQCSTNNNQEASLQIDCGNKTYSEPKIGKIVEDICKYTKSDLNNKVGKLFDISCKIDGKVACENDLIVDEGILGVCGDGIKQGYEQCDLGENGIRIGDYLDKARTVPAPRDIKGKICNNCAVQGENAAQCLSVFNENISIEKGEYLPFWWKLDTNSFSSSTDCKNNSDKGKIIKSTLECVFELQRPDGKTENIRTGPCRFAYPYPWKSFDIFNYFSGYMSENTRAYAVNTSTKNIYNFINAFGEYKLRLSSVTYDYCDDNYKVGQSQTDNICETNMTITQPYMVQKSAFGVNPKATNINLDNFRDINGDNIIGRTDLADIMILDANDYKSIDINFMVESFIKQTENLAIKININSIPNGLRNDGITAKKIQNKDIYILEGKGNGQNIRIKKDTNITKPFTIIVKDANLVIDGDMTVNGMFIVKGGTIQFEKNDCNSKQVVKGIFIADKFDSEEYKNNDLRKERCSQGGLQIKGVLIGGGITDLVENRRSTLSNRFRVNGSENSIKVQRRNQIFRGSAVEIEYSPELWQQLPPGADEFTQMLDIYKK